MPAPGHFEIHAENLARARKFYGVAFGWSFARQAYLIDKEENMLGIHQIDTSAK